MLLHRTGWGPYVIVEGVVGEGVIDIVMYVCTCVCM
jgi:hypothetical protein